MIHDAPELNSRVEGDTVVNLSNPSLQLIHQVHLSDL